MSYEEATCRTFQPGGGKPPEGASLLCQEMRLGNVPRQGREAVRLSGVHRVQGTGTEILLGLQLSTRLPGPGEPQERLYDVLHCGQQLRTLFLRRLPHVC